MDKIIPLGPKRLTKQLTDVGLRRVGTAIEAELKRTVDLETLGFEANEFGGLMAEGCRVILYSCFGEWEVDIILPNGSAVAFDIPVDKVAGRTAEEIAKSRADVSTRAVEDDLIEIENRVREDFVRIGIDYTEEEVAAEARRLAHARAEARLEEFDDNEGRL